MTRWVVIAVMAFGLPIFSAWAALSPDISSAQIRDFTRLTFNWPEQIRFRVEPFEGGVTLNFSQPTDIAPSQLRSGSLAGVVSNVSSSADGTRITLRFSKPYRVRHFVSGNANGIDILGASKPAPAAPAPKPKAKAEALPAPTAKPTRGETQVAAIPETPAEPPQPLVQTPAPQVAPEAEAAAEASAPAPQEQTPPAADETTTDEDEPASNEATSEAPKLPVTEDPFSSEVLEDNAAQNALDAEAVQEDSGEQEISEAPPAAEIAIEPSAPEPEPQPALAKPQEITPEETVLPAPYAAEVIAPQALPPEPDTLQQAQAMLDSASGNAAPLASSMPLSAPSQADVSAGTNLEPEPAPASFTEAPSMEQADTNAGDGSFLISTYSLATGTEIRFPWVKRVASAVFMRENTLWVVFNEERRINMTMLQSILPASILEVAQVPLSGHTVLRMQTDGTVYPKVSQPKNSAQWWVTLSIYRQMPSRPIVIERKISGASKPNLYVPSLQYAQPVTFEDPIVGDELMVVPYYTAGEGVYPARELPELEILASAQGLASVKKEDFAEIRQLRNGFRLTSKNGLSLSEDLPELALAELESFGQSVTWFPYENWRVEAGQFFDVRHELERQLQDATDVRANSLRLKLAQLYLGEGLANEALAWLQIIEGKDPFFFKDRKLEALRGAAHFLNDNYAQARQSFADDALSNSEEQKLWQEALAIFETQRPRFDYMDYFPIFISKYPPMLREKLGIIATDNYINRRSFTRAIKTLDTLSLTGLRERASPYVYFLLGKVAAENGNLKGAKELWEPLIQDGSDRFVRATAEFALTTMQLNANEIDRDEAIKRLDKLRVVWRGDALEMVMLDYLAQLYADDGQYLQALRAWQDLVQNYSDDPIAIASARKMAENFNYLFTEGGADALTPLQALSTFYEFSQLTPIGAAGDIMVQKLADRLIAVDLLERASAMLEDQIKFRQEKLARSQLGAKLAAIYLMNERPEKALEKLELTGFGKMPEELSIRRKRLAALALAETGEPQRALAMLSNDASREADALRLKLYWDMRDWPGAITTGEQLLGSRADVTAPLSAAETEQLLQLSIAYMFERNRNQLDYLRNYFAALMPDGPNKEIFMFVTNPGAPLDPQQFEKVAGQIAHMESFMKSYRQQVQEGGLSPTLN